MARQDIPLTEPLRDSNPKINANFTELYARVANVKEFGAVGDGVADDTAAIRSAIAALSGGVLYFPPGDYGIDETTASEIFLLTKSLILKGAGDHSRIIVGGTVPNTTDVFRYAPDTGEETFFSVRDLRIQPEQNTTPARHAIHADLSTAGSYARRLLIEGCWLDKFGGFSVAATDTGAQPSIFTSDIHRNQILGGINLSAAADSIAITRNVIAGTGRGIEVDLVAGAAVLDISKNNITATGGTLIHRAHHPVIVENYFEILSGATPDLVNNALLDLAGDTGAIIHAVVGNNTLAALVAGVECVRVDNCVAPSVVENDVSTTSGVPAVRVTQQASRPRVRNHQYGAGLEVASASRRLLGRGAPDPATSVVLREEFAGGNVANGSIGDLGWTYGNGLIAHLSAVAGRVGVMQRHTNAQANLYAYTILRSIASAGVFHTSDYFDSTWILKLNHNDADTLLRVGFSEGVGNPPANGIYLEKLADADTNWYAVTRSGGVETRTSLGAISTGWVRLRTRRMDAATISLSINDGAEVTHTTNIPSVALVPNLAIMSATTATKSVDIDYFDLFVERLSR